MLSLKHYIIICYKVISCGMTNYDSKWINKQTNNNNNRVKRIIGGNNSYGWKYSWYCVLITVSDGDANCGASLITTNYLLTAAHCFDEYIYTPTLPLFIILYEI